VEGSQEFTLGDLLADDRLGLELVIGERRCLERTIVGAHSIEIEHPTRWLDRGWVMLTTGVHLSSDPLEQRRLVAELDEAELAALGFGVDVVHRAIPDAVLEEAAAREFPVFIVPLRTAFRDVITVVYESVLSSEIRAFHRIAAMQRFLMDAIGAENPRETVVRRLASLIGARVGILRATGEVELSTAELPAEEIAAEVARHRSLAVAFSARGLNGFAFPIVTDNARETPWLVVAVPEGKQLHPLVRPAAHATVPLLAAMARLDRAQEQRDRMARRAICELLLDVREPHEASVVAAQATACGLDFDDGVAAVAAVDPSGREPAADVLSAFEAALAAAAVPFLGMVRDECVCGVLAAAAPIEDCVRSARPELRVGVGRSVTTAPEVRRSLDDAHLALRQGTSAGVVRYDELGFRTVLLNELPYDRLGGKMDDWLAPLRDNALAREAVEAYLDHGLDVGRTARALHLHPNSVRYRLARAEELIGAPLRSPETILALVVALRGETT
jgi:purine catabolism regulator